MPKKTFLLILFLITATVGLVFLAVYQQKPEEEPEIPAKQEVNADSTLSFGEAVLEGTVYSAPVIINSGTNELTGVQLELIYNPNEINSVKIEEGDYFKNQVILLKEVNQQAGRATLAVGIQPGGDAVTGEGRVAVLSFVPKTGVTKTTVKFLNKTQIAAKDVRKSVLKTSIDGKFTIEPVINNQAPSLPQSTTPSGI